MFNAADRTFVDSQCGIIEKGHIDEDNAEHHLKVDIGTTGTGTVLQMQIERCEL